MRLGQRAPYGRTAPGARASRASQSRLTSTQFERAASLPQSARPSEAAHLPRLVVPHARLDRVRQSRSNVLVRVVANHLKLSNRSMKIMPPLLRQLPTAVLVSPLPRRQATNDPHPLPMARLRERQRVQNPRHRRERESPSYVFLGRPPQRSWHAFSAASIASTSSSRLCGRHRSPRFAKSIARPAPHAPPTPPHRRHPSRTPRRPASPPARPAESPSEPQSTASP